jgi:hypothetical protein
MSKLRFMPQMFAAFSLFAGCKNDPPITSRANQPTANSSATDQTSITNVVLYYRFDRGRGVANYLPASAFFMTNDPGGTEVLVTNEQFPPPPEMPTLPAKSTPRPLSGLDLIETNPR